MDESPDESGVVARSRSHFLVRDGDGYALYSVDQDGDDPLLTFPADAQERAFEAFRVRSKETARVRWLGISAVAAGVLYLAANVAQVVLTLVPERPDLSGGWVGVIEVSPWDRLRMILFAVDQFALASLLVSVGWFLVAWLQRRWRREG